MEDAIDVNFCRIVELIEGTVREFQDDFCGNDKKIAEVGCGRRMNIVRLARGMSRNLSIRKRTATARFFGGLLHKTLGTKFVATCKEHFQRGATNDA